MADAAEPLPSPINTLAPYTTESYNGEQREMYDDRTDLLKYRSVGIKQIVPPKALPYSPTVGETISDGDFASNSTASPSSPLTLAEVRLYRYGRKDGMREVEAAVEYAGDRETCAVHSISLCFFSAVFAPFPRREVPDGLSMARRWLDKETGTWNYVIVFDRAYSFPSAASGDQQSPASSFLTADLVGKYCIKSVHISLEKGERIAVEASHATVCTTNASDETDATASIDNAVSLIKRKVNHVAIRFDVDAAMERLVSVASGEGEETANRSVAEIAEIYQDIGEEQTLRICRKDTVFNRIASIDTFPLFTYTDDARFEFARRAVMVGLKLVVAVERELAVLSATAGVGWLGEAPSW